VQDFTVSAPAAGAVTVSLPDFARGPNQVVNVPASVSTGLPLTLTNDGQVYAIDVQISYDPSLLNITGATVAAGMPAGSTAAINAETPGLAIVGFSSPTPLPAGTVNFVDLQANVPLTAGYGSKQVLDLHQLSINEGAIPALDNDGVQVVAYLGDVTGNGTYSSLDTSRVSRVAVGLDTGFAAFPLADPVLLADITGNGTISSLDTSKVSRLAVGLSVPEVPALPSPSASPLIVGGPDPKLSIPTTLIATPGGSVTVPVNIDSIVDLSASPFFAADLVILFDPAVFSAHSVALGAVPASHPAAGWGLAEANIDNASGRVIIGLANSRGLGGTFEGSLVTIDFTVKPGAPAGPSPINLAASSAPFTTQLNEGGLTLIPAPTNAANDNGVDGVVSVTAHPWQNPKNPLDVNDQGGVTALDALLIISYVNAHETGPLPPTSESPTSYVDVNGDDAVTPLDVLAVVGYLNGQIGSPAGNSEGEASTQPTGTVDASSLPSQTPITVAASEPVFAPALAGSADTMWGTMFPLVPLGVPVESGPSHGVQYLLEDSHLPERLVVHESAAEAQLVNSLTAADHKTTDFRDLVDSVFTELGEAT
ncbi:MAG: dockerin type I domain-containing protein, partial [Planctomycetota bacterium]|nr:dockerin type I domain-containing protein [Planctomycetota bacterium]